MLMNVFISNFLDRMKESGFVDGFEKSIVKNLGNELCDNFGISWSEWWRDNCMIEILPGPTQYETVLSKWFGGDVELFNRYIEQAKWSRENSKFSMPSWGTSGT